MVAMEGRSGAEEWYKNGKATTLTRNMIILLDMLPSSYEDTSTLKKLFNLFVTNSSIGETFFSENETLMRQCFGLSLVKNLAAHDSMILDYLEGYWTGSGYYFSFYENTNGGMNTSYNLPWVSEPSGTKYYDIEDGIYYYDNANGDHLTKVYQFEIVSYDVIKVYCYKNGRTYTMYRS